MSTVGIWGAGAEGSSAARTLIGKQVLVVDELSTTRPPTLPATVRFAAGPAALAQLLDCAEVIISPGVPGVHPFREQLAAAGVQVTSLTDLWLRSSSRTTIGVTGTKGKSTTATLLHLLLEGMGLDSQLGGNIGVPLADLREGAQVTVAELSSYQCSSISVAPKIAVITSLYEDHLTWHGSKDAYWQDKAKIAGDGCEALVCDAETLARLRSISAPLPGQLLTLDDNGPFPVELAALPSPLQLTQNLHNLRLAVVAASAWLGRALSADEILAAVARFRPLPHRLSQVSTLRGVRWIDDTLSTVPESVVVAIKAFPGEMVVILGGQDRGLDYAPLTGYLRQRSPLPTLISIPGNGRRIVADYEAFAPDRVRHAATLAEAVAIAADIAEPAATVLLSPGAPSYDYFKNFEQKSDAFAEAIAKL